MYYRAVKSTPTVRPEPAGPIKQLIEAEPSFGYRTVAGSILKSASIWVVNTLRKYLRSSHSRPTHIERRFADGKDILMIGPGTLAIKQ